MSFLFSFQGTISRTQFWLGMLAALVGVLLLAVLVDLFVPVGTWAAMVFFFVLLFGVIWVILALHAKRLRDAGLSPWLCLLFFVLLADLVLLLVVGVKPTVVKRTDAPMR